MKQKKKTCISGLELCITLEKVHYRIGVKPRSGLKKLPKWGMPTHREVWRYYIIPAMVF